MGVSDYHLRHCITVENPWPAQGRGAEKNAQGQRDAVLCFHGFLCLHPFFSILSYLECLDPGGNFLVREKRAGTMVVGGYVDYLWSFLCSVPSLAEAGRKGQIGSDDHGGCSCLVHSFL